MLNIFSSCLFVGTAVTATRLYVADFLSGLLSDWRVAGSRVSRKLGGECNLVTEKVKVV